MIDIRADGYSGLMFMIIALFLLSSCAFTSNVVQDTVSENGTIEVYFCPQDNCSRILAENIRAAEDVACAFYDVSSPDVLAAITAGKAAVVIDDENYFGLGTKAYAQGIMHDKFCIFDRTRIFSGSYNPTAGGNSHRNNIVLIDSQFLANNYLQEFKELNANVPQDKKERTRYQKILLSGVLIENYFCPEDQCEEHVLSAIMTADESVSFMTYSFTADRIGDYLVSQNSRLDIRGIFEEQQLGEYSEYEKMNKGRMKVKVDEQPYLQHNKVFILDNETVITGSFNPSQNADKNNDENILIIHSPEIAQKYLAEFEKTWSRI
ncbi:MAG: phospholipase D-like domain-containing protein [Nanoarchaeota archaeon]